MRIRGGLIRRLALASQIIAFLATSPDRPVTGQASEHSRLCGGSPPFGREEAEGNLTSSGRIRLDPFEREPGELRKSLRHRTSRDSRREALGRLR